MEHLQFKEIRKDILKITQKEMGDALGMASNTIARMERGEIQIEKRTILALRWIVYDANGVTFTVRESGPIKTAEVKIVDLVSDLILKRYFLSEAVLSEALDKLNLVTQEFGLCDDKKIQLINSIQNPSVLLNIRHLRRAVECI